MNDTLKVPADGTNGDETPNQTPAPQEQAPSKPNAIERVTAANDRLKAEKDALQAKLDAIEAEKAKEAEEKMKANQQYKELLDQKEKELAQLKADKEAKEKRLQEIEEAREKEIEALLQSLPEDARPPLDPNSSSEVRLKQLQYAESLLTKKKNLGGGQPPAPAPTDASTRIAELKAKPELTQDEKFELLSLSVQV